ncbi:hypothetical protein TNCV_772101 [Trichonephila clavipes]|nr:hypothetical protein TNCV_772101 [Trichonephila clavipes]
MDWYLDNGVSRLDWPTQSSHLNPIVNLWSKFSDMSKTSGCSFLREKIFRMEKDLDTRQVFMKTLISLAAIRDEEKTA